MEDIHFAFSHQTSFDCVFIFTDRRESLLVILQELFSCSKIILLNITMMKSLQKYILKAELYL